MKVTTEEYPQEKQNVAYRDGIAKMVNSIDEWRILRYIYIMVEDIVKERKV
jgi:hypothetical protein